MLGGTGMCLFSARELEFVHGKKLYSMLQIHSFEAGCLRWEGDHPISYYGGTAEFVDNSSNIAKHIARDLDSGVSAQDLTVCPALHQPHTVGPGPSRPCLHLPNGCARTYFICLLQRFSDLML